MQIKLHIDNIPYTSKPEAKEIGRINNRITNKVSELNLQEVVWKITMGHTILPTVMKGKRSIRNMVSQQMVLLDFDNDEEGKQISMAEVMNMSFTQENASFIYKSFSHTENHEKFRLAFVLDKSIKKPNEVKGIYHYLLEQYPQADTQCLEPARMFFGGYGAEAINLKNKLNTNEALDSRQLDLNLYQEEQNLQVKKVKPKQTAGKEPTWLLIRQGKKEQVRERLSAYSTRLHSKVQVVNYMKRQNLRDILEVDGSNPFHDIFHEEENPSASIFEMDNGSGIFLYKCHSATEPFMGDIVHVISKLTELSYMESIDYLIDVCNISIEVTEEIQTMRDQCDTLLNLFVSEEFKDTYPAIHSIFWRYKTDIYTIMNIFKENVYEDEDGELRSLTWMSTRTLAQKLYGDQNKYKKVLRILNLMTYTNWIDKLDESQIPKTLLEKIRRVQNINKRSKRSNVFEMVLHNSDFFTELNKQCEVMKETGFTIKGLSKESLQKGHNDKVADKVFVQDKNRKVSKKTEAFLRDMATITMNMINTNGIAIQNEVKEELEGKWKSKGFVDYKYKQMLPHMLEAYSLEKKRLTKDIKEELQIELPPKSAPTILMAV